MASESVAVKPEWPMAMLDSIRILMNRGYLHTPKDVEIVRPGHDSVFPCGAGGGEGPLKLAQVEWTVEKGKLFFNWYIGSYLSLKLKKGSFKQEVTFDPTKQNAWDFVKEVDQTFQ